ncbi:transposon Ty3-I Gag-Pol polyprotein isoform X1 [Cucumis melo var. makuwa]|uniref:Transposon Ty3-I Gag-Pol polyprotein isoform X1 n=1 Tax=Cucumis melo var. makuwa TaxID=1194695 RepID=A0A5D3BJE7_CUCMM|nr:transposon Ty3-I Gag-Pol polyprotein isoform X1 [Cucumis melo var. makuwa]TYJ98831.1 transposon Ty3-I Gag-Pol polyprotein isoform X1 [Cucumis melo var. makuwa]
MGKLPFEVVCTHLPRLTLDLANLPSFVDVSSVVEAMVDQISKLHQEVKDDLEAASNAYKPAADSKKKLGSKCFQPVEQLLFFSSFVVSS